MSARAHRGGGAGSSGSMASPASRTAEADAEGRAAAAAASAAAAAASPSVAPLAPHAPTPVSANTAADGARAGAGAAATPMANGRIPLRLESSRLSGGGGGGGPVTGAGSPSSSPPLPKATPSLKQARAPQLPPAAPAAHMRATSAGESQSHGAQQQLPVFIDVRAETGRQSPTPPLHVSTVGPFRPPFHSFKSSPSFFPSQRMQSSLLVYTPPAGGTPVLCPQTLAQLPGTATQEEHTPLADIRRIRKRAPMPLSAQPAAKTEEAAATAVAGPAAAPSHHGRSASRYALGAKDGVVAADDRRTPCWRRFCHRWSFSTIVSVIMALILTAALLFVYLTSLAASHAMVHDITLDYRRELLRNVVDEASDRFSSVLDAAHAVRFAVGQRFPDFNDLRVLSNATGWLGPLSAVGRISPDISRIGAVNRYDTLMALAQSDPEGYFNSGVGGNQVSVLLGENFATHMHGNETHLSHNHTLQIFTPRRFALTRANRYAPRLTVVSEVRSYSSVEDIEAYLGPQNGTLEANTTPTYADHIGQRLRAAGTTTIWAEKSPDADTPSEYERLYAFSRFEDPAVDVDAFATRGRPALSFAALDMHTFAQLFQRLELGVHGMALLFSPNGTLRASSVLHPEQHGSMEEQTVCKILLPHLLECGLVTLQRVSLLNASSVLRTNDDAQRCEHSFRFNGHTFLMQAALLNQSATALPFSVAIITRSEDFLGSHLHTAQVQAASFAGGALAVAVIASFLTARLLTRPIAILVAFMARVRRITAMPSSEEKKRLMCRLQLQWNALTDTIDPDAIAAAVATCRRSPSGVLECDDFPDLSGLPSRRFAIKSQEVLVMERTFGDLLQSWAGYDELEALNHSKRQFIRYIFHEVRVPFNAIVLGVEQLQNDIAKHRHLLPDALDTLAILSEQSGAVTHILNDVLSLQKIEDGALTLEFTTFDLERMLRTTLYSFKAPCTERSLRLKAQLADVQEVVWTALRQRVPAIDHCMLTRFCNKQLPRFGLVGDMHRLRQVLSNYVSNAIKFSKRGGEEIRVSLALEEMEVSGALICALSRHECVDESSTEALRSELCKRPLGSVRVTVCVADSGHGVPQEHQANLFKAYMQIDAGKLQRSKGTGLGLSVSKSIMELHAGEVGFRPEPLGGSVFFFTLPMAVHVMPEEESRGSRPAAQSTEKGSSSTHLPGSPSEGAREHIAELVPGGVSHPASLGELEEHIVAVQSEANLPGCVADAPALQSSRPAPTPTAAPIREWPLSVAGSAQPSTAGAAAPTDESNLFVAARQSFSESPQAVAVGATPRASPSTRPSAPPVAPGARVLVVEDSAPNRRLLQKLLTRMGCVTSAAENGEECLRYFDNAAAAELSPSQQQQQHQPFDLVLMDNSMPVMDGMTATRLLRERGITVPIVGVTGNALDEDIRSFVEAGANEILTKPVSTGQLERVLRVFTRGSNNCASSSPHLLNASPQLLSSHLSPEAADTPVMRLVSLTSVPTSEHTSTST